MVAPAALMGIGAGVKALGGLLGKSSAQKQAEAQAQAEKAAWDSKEQARVRRCQNLTNWARVYFAQKKIDPPGGIPKPGTDNCPPPQPYAGATKQYGPSLSEVAGQIGGGIAQYGASKYAEQQADPYAAIGGGVKASPAPGGTNYTGKWF